MSEVKLVLRGAFQEIFQTRNVFYLTSPGTGNIPSQAGVQSYMSSMWTTAVKALLTGNWHAPTVDVATLVGGDWVIQDQYNLTGIVGTDNAVDPLPYTCAVCIIGRTGVRRVVPKKYVGGILESYGQQGTILSAQLTTWQAFADAWVTPFTDATIEWTPMTQLQLGTFTQILHAHPSPLIATMRSRKQNVGI